MQADEAVGHGYDSDEWYDDEEEDYHTEGHPRDYPEPCIGDQCRDWMVKIKDFRPSYKGGGGGGGGATMIFKVSSKHLVI